MDATDAELTLLYRRHLALVRGRALRIVGSPAAADDVVQEVFMRYLQRVRKGALPELNTAGFLYQMATHCALNSLRSQGRRGKYESRAQHESQAILEGPGSSPNLEDALLVRDLLTRVPQREAILAAYYYLDGLEHEEIATLMDMPRRQVGRRLEDFKARARKLLGRPLQQEARRVVDG